MTDMVPQLFPYMGSKRLFAPVIMPMLRSLADEATAYVEPFLGSGAIGVRTASDFPSLSHKWNDADPRIAAIWRAVRDHTEELTVMVKSFVPSIQAFLEFRASTQAGTDSDRVVIDGFQQLALRYMCFSGIGSGCRGGYEQTYGRINEIWNANRLIAKINLVSRRMQRCEVELRCEDFAAVLADADDRTFMFLDPPYWIQGDAFTATRYYERTFNRDDHRRLADLLGTTPARWLLTYGEHPDIRRLYGWARISEIGHRTLLICKR